MDGLIAYALAKKYADKVGENVSREGFRIQVEQDRSILNSTGNEKIFYFLPKNSAKTRDGYDEFIYANNRWEQVGATDIDLSDYATKEWVAQQLAEFGKTDLSNATVTLSTDTYTYDGVSKTPTVSSVVLNDVTLIEDTDYVVAISPATDAGDYSVLIYGIGDYDGVATAPWSIAKAQAVISGDSTITISENDSPVSKTYTSDSDGAFSFSISDNTVASISNNGGTVTVTPLAVGTAAITVTLAEGANYLGATRTVPVEIVSTATVFGVMWDYSLSSPQLVRLTPQTDPLGVVTTVPSQEPTACVGNDGNGQSDFDNYMPWKGMRRYNYIDGQIVDFVDYQNGETFVYIPEFWSKIVNDITNSKMYFYISGAELSTFVKHPGGGRYMSRYECDSTFLSVSGSMPKVATSLSAFRTGITAIDNKHFQYDFHTYNAIELLYIVEFANLDSQSKIGAGITSANAVMATGLTDVLTYHTGRINGTDNLCPIQYRWIENLWGNCWNCVDGILIYNADVYICDDNSKYASVLTVNYTSIGHSIPVNKDWIKNYISNDDKYLLPSITSNSSSTTYACDFYGGNTGLNGLYIGGGYGDGVSSGLFCWRALYSPDSSYYDLSSRSILILGGDS